MFYIGQWIFFLSHKESTTSKRDRRPQQSVLENLRCVLGCSGHAEGRDTSCGSARAVPAPLTHPRHRRTSKVMFAGSNTDILVIPARVIRQRNFASGRSDRCPPSSSEN